MVEPGHFQPELRSVTSDHDADGQKDEQKTATMEVVRAAPVQFGIEIGRNRSW